MRHAISSDSSERLDDLLRLIRSILETTKRALGEGELNL
jgi:hypothetical protein